MGVVFVYVVTPNKTINEKQSLSMHRTKHKYLDNNTCNKCYKIYQR